MTNQWKAPAEPGLSDLMLPWDGQPTFDSRLSIEARASP
jgi:hypothetical protein